MKAYKLFRVRKDGSLGSLFIDRNLVLEVGKWYKSKEKRTKGYKFRPGWHALTQPEAPHLSTKGRAWYLVELRGKINTFQRPEAQGGTWLLATKMKIIRGVKDYR